MDHRTQVFLLLISTPFLVLANHQTSSLDVTGLRSLRELWTNTPPSWGTLDPCEDGWDGIECHNMRVVSLKLPSMNLTGTLSGDIGQLSELQILDLSYNKGLTGPLPEKIGSLKKLSNIILVGCSFSGPIPPTIGSLQELIFLSLNSNGFSGTIPSSIGNLSKLYWLDLADNHLEGPIPVSDGGEPGLDMLSHCKHFHLGMNKLSGPIPSKLFSSNMSLIHVLFESNKLTGIIPPSLGHVTSLEVVRFDGNMLTGPIPPSLNSLTHVSQLFLSNNKLSGPAPNLTGMNLLQYVDLSNNSFDVSDVPPWFSTLESLTTLIMEGTELQGEIPAALFSLSNLQTVVLRNNQLSGTLDIGTTSSQLQLIDLQKNFIMEYEGNGGYNGTLMKKYISTKLADPSPHGDERTQTEEENQKNQTKRNLTNIATKCNFSFLGFFLFLDFWSVFFFLYNKQIRTLVSQYDLSSKMELEKYFNMSYPNLRIMRLVHPHNRFSAEL